MTPARHTGMPIKEMSVADLLSAPAGDDAANNKVVHSEEEIRKAMLMVEDQSDVQAMQRY